MSHPDACAVVALVHTELRQRVGLRLGAIGALVERNFVAGGGLAGLRSTVEERCGTDLLDFTPDTESAARLLAAVSALASSSTPRRMMRERNKRRLYNNERGTQSIKMMHRRGKIRMHCTNKAS